MSRSPLADFPREDLAPLRHQQVRALLVREATGSRAARRSAAARRLAPVMAALGVVVLVAAVPTTGPGAELLAAARSALEDAQNPCPQRGEDTGYTPRSRRPGAHDRTQAVRYLPRDRAVRQVRFAMESSCVLPERADRPVQRTHPVWTLARIDGSGRVAASAVLYRGAPPGISQQVADRTSQWLPTDQSDPGDPGSVLDPPYTPVTVRGVTGTATQTGPRGLGGATIVWAEPDGLTWSLQTLGLKQAEVVDLAEGLAIEGTAAEPGRTPALTPERLSVDQPDGETYWLRLDVPSPTTPEVDTVTWNPYLRAWFRSDRSGTDAVLEVWGPFAAGAVDDWRQFITPGDEITHLGGAPALLQMGPGTTGPNRSDQPFAALLWTTPRGGHASLSLRGATETPHAASGGELLDLANVLTPVPADDTRLARASVDPE